MVLGAGAAGLMAALHAGRRGRSVMVLDHGERPGRKILISGGGRCNFTNLRTSAENFFSDNPHFVRSGLSRYTPGDFLQMVEQHGIRYHEKTLGQLFCDDSAHRILTMLLDECGAAGVDIRCGTRVLEVQPSGVEATRFNLTTAQGEIACQSVVVATGGLSIPKLGATGFGYEVARKFGHGVVEPRAALVPLVLAKDEVADWCDLPGISTEVVATVASAKVGNSRQRPMPSFREKLLVTHRGLSGPVVLQISTPWRAGDEVSFDLAPGRDVLAPLLAKHARRDRGALLGTLREVLPARLAERWVEIQLRHGESWSNAGLAQLEQALHRWVVRPAGTEGFAKAEVTAGGVSTQELDARTMQSRRVPGLFFAGEVVDVTGWLGGYNFQWAWASGYAAGLAA